MRFDDLAQRPERDPLAVGQASALPPRDQLVQAVGVVEQLRDQAGLAHARLAGDGDELGRPLCDRLVEGAAQQREVELTPDERRRQRPDHIRAEARRRSQCPPDGDRLGLALGVDRVERLVLEHPLGRSERGLTDRDPVHRRLRLDPGRRVDDVPGDHRLAEFRPHVERDHRLAGVDPDPHRQVERFELFQQGQPGPHRPLRVVLVCGRRAEDRHHRVADELLDPSAVCLDPIARARVVRSDPRLHLLGVGALRRGGEADKVAEEHRHDFPLLCVPARRGR